MHNHNKIEVADYQKFGRKVQRYVETHKNNLKLNLKYICYQKFFGILLCYLGIIFLLSLCIFLLCFLLFPNSYWFLAQWHRDLPLGTRSSTEDPFFSPTTFLSYPFLKTPCYLFKRTVALAIIIILTLLHKHESIIQSQ